MVKMPNPVPKGARKPKPPVAPPRAVNEDLIRALKYYADPKNYQPKMAWSSDGGVMVAPIEDDGGEKARRALKDYNNHLDKTNYWEGS